MNLVNPEFVTNAEKHCNSIAVAETVLMAGERIIAVSETLKLLYTWLVVLTRGAYSETA